MLLSDPFFIGIAIACLVVLGILMLGVGSFARGGAFNQRNANRFMRWRIYAQGLAVLLIVTWAWMRSGG